jgi:hypothetical protein
MAKMKDTLCVDVPLLNDCIICDCEATAKAEGRKSWSVSISGQPLCGDHRWEIMMERMD